MSKAELLIEEYLQSQVSEERTDEQVKTIVKLVWKKLPPKLKKEVDLKQVDSALMALEYSDRMSSLAKDTKLLPVKAAELVQAIVDTGLV